MRKESNNVQDDLLENLKSLLEKEKKLDNKPSLQELYDRLYHSLYAMRDYSVEFENPSSRTLKQKVLKIYRSIWKIGALPYIRYHNQFHATLINTVFIQHALLKELESKIEKGQQPNNGEK